MIVRSNRCVHSGRDAARPVRVDRRRRDRALAVRAARAARAAVRGAIGGRRRPLRHRARAGHHVHGHDRRASRRWSTASGWATRRCATSRSSRCRCSGSRCRAAAARRPAGGAAVAAGALRAEARRPRLLVRAAGGRGARLRLRALRRPDPRRGGVGRRRLRARPSRSAVAYALGSAIVLLHPRARRAGACSTGEGGPGLSSRRARRGDGADRRGDGVPRSTCASRPRWPITCPPRSSTRRRARSSLNGRRASGSRAAPARRFAERGAAGSKLPVSARRPTSSATSAGSTPAADARRAARPGRAHRLLDLHLHQLHPHAAAR